MIFSKIIFMSLTSLNKLFPISLSFKSKLIDFVSNFFVKISIFEKISLRIVLSVLIPLKLLPSIFFYWLIVFYFFFFFNKTFMNFFKF
jgi:hypothetical protein